MTGRAKFIFSLLAAVGIFLLIQVALFLFYTDESRDPKSLLNQYYQLRYKDPMAAKRALELILKSNPNNLPIQMELGYWYLQQGDTYHALQQFELVLKRDPHHKKAAYELASLYQLIGNKEKAETLFRLSGISETTPVTTGVSMNATKLATLHFPITNVANRLAVSPIQHDMPITAEVKALTISPRDSKVKKAVATSMKPSVKIVQTQTERDKLLNQFYEAKKKNNKADAWIAINALLARYPYDLVALKEAGYYALSEKNDQLAFYYLSRAYVISQDPYLALQNGYILDNLNQKVLAYHYFDLATKTKNTTERLKAELAKTNLRGVQTRLLPDPFFAEFYFNPFYFSRFKLLVYPFVFRTGFTISEKYHMQLYLIYRRTSDNKSGNFGVLSNIYEDNAAITSLGLSFTPFSTQPLIAFIEAGKAVDLVYRNRARWRNDLRAGAAYFNEWGYAADYTLKPVLRAKLKADLYADAIYYSRYTDWIATARARPGIEVFRYGSTSLIFYYKGYLVQDTNRFFYNNVFEHGPSVVFIPSDRYNMALRYENLTGHYLPSGGKFQNPYPPKYHNNNTELDIYFRF